MAKRIFYGSSALATKTKYVSSIGSGGVPEKAVSNWFHPRGIQSVGFATSVAFEPMFQMGQTEVYGRMESQSPEVEATISKAIDGSQPLYTTLMGGQTPANNKLPVELSDNEVELELLVYSESVPYASGTPQSVVYCSGMYVSNVTINLPLDGVATEEITLVGDTKQWTTNRKSDEIGASANDRGWIGSGIARASYQRWKVDTTNSTLPSGVSGSPLQSVSVTMAMGRESIQELGTRGKYCRYATFPFEVTSEFEVIAGKYDSATATVDSAYNFENNFSQSCSPTIEGGFSNQRISIAVCGNGNPDDNETGTGTLTIDLGDKNKITSVNHSGGDTGGGNVTLTYSFQNYNFFKLNGTGSFAIDPDSSGRGGGGGGGGGGG
jgi:hypothetical protein